MILRVIAFIGAIASLYGYLVPTSFPNSQIAAAAVGGFLFLLYVGTEIYTFITNRDFIVRASDTAKINREMKKIIVSPGRTSILSRDLSWAGAADIRACLSEKASANELVIYLEKGTAISSELQKAGARVVEYGPLGFVPESRFTMMNIGKPHATIAIGFVRGDRHVITRHRNGHDASFHIADDLVRLLEAVT
jgi:hypothetical protein